MFSAALVAAHHALDVLSVLVALSAEGHQRTAGLRAGRARRGALLGLVQVVSTAAAAAARRVPPRRRHQRHAPREPAEIMMVVPAGQRVGRHAVRRALERRRRGRAADRAADARHAGAAAASGHCA